MKNFVENMSEEKKLWFSILLYITFLLVFRLIFDTTEIFFSIFINPFFFFGILYLILDYSRYRELKRIYKNYTTEQFIEVYKKASELAYNDEVVFSNIFLYETIYYDKRTILKLRPLARNILSLSHYYDDTEDLKNNEVTMEEFITRKYWDKFDIKNIFSTSVSFYYILFGGVWCQLILWGIIESNE